MASEICAHCGKGESGSEGGTVKLKNCVACYVVKYCSVDCQKADRPTHKRACKRRAAELRDERLFSSGHEFYLGDCPICTIPFPLSAYERSFTSCCVKTICLGCDIASADSPLCPFCRSDQESVVPGMRVAMVRARMEKGDPVAYEKLGCFYDVNILDHACFSCHTALTPLLP